MLKASLASKEERWSPHDKNWFKLNSDAAINETEGLARLGVVIRNSREEFKATSICRRPFCVLLNLWKLVRYWKVSNW